MIEPWLLAIILITVLTVGLALYVDSQPVVPTREEKERNEILTLLRHIEATLNHEATKSLVSPENALQKTRTRNPKECHEEND